MSEELQTREQMLQGLSRPTPKSGESATGEEHLSMRVNRLLQDDPVCCGRVTVETIDRIAALSTPAENGEHTEEAHGMVAPIPVEGEILQADRDALARIDDALGFLMDNEREIVLQAFARHRLTFSRGVDEVREAEDACFIAAEPVASPDDLDEDDNPLWTAEVQTVGGWSVVATVWGASPEQASARAAAVASALSTIEEPRG